MGEPSQQVDAYLQTLTPERREALSQARALIRQMAPEAEEMIRYKMPAYEYDGHIVCAFASQKQYMSLYVDIELLQAHRAELAGLNTARSCIRFRRIEDLPLDTVQEILRETMIKLRE
jgi:uncharacterized protein YdhG (YjbR/CyaY superfamily)